MTPNGVVADLLAFAAGVLSGFFNVVAGGGSLLSLPALIFFAGLTPTEANATNRLAILFQNIVAVARYTRRKIGEPRLGFVLAAVSTPGALLGAWSASVVDDRTIRPIMGILFLGVLASIVRSPGNWLDPPSTPPSRARRFGFYASFFFLGFYGGFIQVGIGVLILAALVRVGGRGLVSANATKVLVILLYTALALAVFAGFGKVRWRSGLSLTLGSMAGAWLGTVVSIERGKRVILWIFAIAVIASSLELLGAVAFIRRTLGLVS